MTIEDSNIVRIDTHAEPLDLLAKAMRRKTLPESEKCRVAEDAGSPDEGLALLRAYRAIDDRDVRQAILDIVLTIGAGKP